MLNQKITSILLAASMFTVFTANPVSAGIIDTAAGINAVRYESGAAAGSGESDQNRLFTSLEEKQEAEKAVLMKIRTETAKAADAAEEAADEALDCAEKTEGEEIEEAADSAVLHAENARAASDLVAAANDMQTVEMTASIAEAAREEASQAAAEAEEAAQAEADRAKKAAEEEAAAKAKAEAEAEAAAREKALASAEYLGTFTLTAYCNCAACNGSAGNPTASGVMPTSGHTVAMGGVPFGTKLLIDGTIYTVEDRGTPYGHVDIFFDSHEEALDFGMGSADVYLIKE